MKTLRRACAWMWMPVLFALAGACVTPVQTAPAPVARPRAQSRSLSRPLHPTLSQATLPSGLRILLDEDPYATAIGVVTVVNGGSTKDPAGMEGLAHLVEHLTYRAIDPVAAGQTVATRWDRLTRLAVGDMNGFTTQDWLMFYEFGPTTRLTALLDVAAARLVDPLVGVDETAFHLERQIIGSEHLLRDDPRSGGWASKALMPLVFPSGHPYARALGGTDETRRALTLAAARTYAREVFRPQEMTVLVTAPSGVFSLEAIAARLPPVLKGDAAHPVVRVAPVKPAAAPAGAKPPASPPAPSATPAPPPAVKRLHSPLPTAELWVAWPLPGATGELVALEDVLSRWVDEDLATAQLSDEDSHIKHVSASLQSGSAASVLQVRAILSDGADAAHVAQVVIGRASSLWAREQAQQTTFIGLRSLFETQQMLDASPQISRALEQALSGTTSEKVPTTNELLTARQTVSSSAAAQFAYQHLTREKAHAVFFSASVPAGETVRAAAAVPSPGTANASAAADPFTEAAAWNPLELPARAPDVPRVTTRRLPSGLTVFTVQRPSATVVAWLGFRGGYSDADPPLLVEVAQRARPEARGATQLHMLPGRGATRDMSFDSVEFGKSQLADGLTLLFAKATAPVKEWPKREQIQSILAPVAASEDAAAMKAGPEFWRALLGADHPRTRPVNTADLGRVSPSDMDAWLGRVRNMKNAVLVVVGDVDPEQVAKGADILSLQLKGQPWVADLPGAPAPTPRPAKTTRLVPLINARAGSLTEIHLGCLLPPLDSGDRGPYELLRYAIESRLNAALRIDHGDGYGAMVSYDRLRGGATYLVASTFLGEQSLQRSLGTIRQHWQRWARDGFSAGELNVARWRYAGSLPLLFGNGHAVAYRMMEDWSVEAATTQATPVQLSDGYLRPDAMAPQSDRVNALFATCKANAIISLTGNEPLIRSSLERAWPGLLVSRGKGGASP